ncbi:MAG: DUF4389 domain-containing protein [Gammaproteobacteria bacterium]|nr:DUF4389 domain-containing protein [Gammaproteobacteria bacterium]
MSDDLKKHLKDQNTWIRGLYMLLFSFLAGIADFVLFGVVIFQFVHRLITGKVNERLLKLGQGLGSYIYQIIQFLTFNSDYHPYPLGAWPRAEPKSVIKASDANQV